MPKTFKDKITTNLRIKGSTVVKRVFTGHYTREQVLKEVQKLQEKNKHKNLMCMVSLIVEEVAEYRSGKSFNLNDKIILLDDYEWDETENFIIYFWKDNGKKSGGDDIYNDCFIISILKIHNSYRLPKDMKTPELFKAKLGLNRDDEISLSLIPKIEKLLELNINVMGDYYYTSKNIHKATANLLLIDGHYTPEIITKGGLLTGIPKMNHKLIVYKIVNDGIECFDGENQYWLSMYQYKQINKKKFVKGESGDVNYIKVIELKELSGGKIDLSKSGYLASNEALKSIHYYIQSLNQGEPVNGLEENWFQYTHKGGIRFIKEDITLENAYEYDIRGSYAYQMSSPKFTFPINQGIFTYINEIPTIVSYGLYRVIIEESDDYSLNHLFKFNEKNIYTHFDINSARLLNLRMTLIKDDEANALLYTQNRVNGSVYFGGLVHYLNDLKMKISAYETINQITNKNRLVKDIMTCLYGTLNSYNKKYVSLHRPVDIVGDKHILNIQESVLTFTEVGSLYKFNFARMGCFLTSSARLRMVNVILPIRDYVYRVFTDSITSNIPLDTYLNVGDKLGDWKPDKSNGKSATIFKNGRKTSWIN